MVAEVDGGDVAENAWQARVHRKPVPPELEKGFHHVLVCEENVSLLSPVKVILRGLFIGLQNLFLGERNYESSLFLCDELFCSTFHVPILRSFFHFSYTLHRRMSTDKWPLCRHPSEEDKNCINFNTMRRTTSDVQFKLLQIQACIVLFAAG